MLFPYRQYQVTPSPAFPDGVLYRPEVRVRITGPAGDVFLRGVVDTGADTTIFPRQVADEIGLAIEDETWQIAGFTGDRTSVVYAEVELTVIQHEEQHHWRGIVGFVEYARPDLQEPLLGRVGFLDQFYAGFDPKRRQLEMHPV